MLQRGSGRIMNVASTAAFQPGPLMAVYYATKAYVLSFSEALAEETRGTGVTVTALCPGPTASGFQAGAAMEHSKLVHGQEAADRGERRGVRRQGDADGRCRRGARASEQGARHVDPLLAPPARTPARPQDASREVTIGEPTVLVNPGRRADEGRRTVGRGDAPIAFHRRLPGYAPTPVVDAPALAAELGSRRCR